jgi:hypothetical protein
MEMMIAASCEVLSMPALGVLYFAIEVSLSRARPARTHPAKKDRGAGFLVSRFGVR